MGWHSGGRQNVHKGGSEAYSCVCLWCCVWTLPFAYHWLVHCSRYPNHSATLGYPFFEVLSSYGCTQAPGFVELPTFMETLRVGGQAWAVKTRRRNVSYLSHSCFMGYFPVESTGQTLSSECSGNNVHWFRQSGVHKINFRLLWSTVALKPQTTFDYVRQWRWCVTSSSGPCLFLSSSYPSIFWLVVSFPSGILASHSLHCRITQLLCFWRLVVNIVVEVFQRPSSCSCSEC